VNHARSELVSARHALACVAHGLNGTLQALFTFLKLSEREAGSPHLSSALAAAARLRDEVQAVHAASVPSTLARFELAAILRQLGDRVELDIDAGDTAVVGDARALGAALRLLVQHVAAGLAADARLAVALRRGERELRVLVGPQVNDEFAQVSLDPFVDKLSLAELVAALVAVAHEGRLLRAGPAGEYRFELELPRPLRAEP
jgi:hypothetical protein